MKPVLANELRIGNIISQGEIDLLEVRRGENDDSLFVRVNGGGVENPTAEPLTEEWLLRFGFERGVASWLMLPTDISLFYSNGCVTSMVYKGEGRVFPLGGSGPYIKSVHQLQNLYFALTGTELTCTTIPFTEVKNETK